MPEPADHATTIREALSCFPVSFPCHAALAALVTQAEQADVPDGWPDGWTVVWEIRRAELRAAEARADRMKHRCREAEAHAQTWDALRKAAEARADQLDRESNEWAAEAAAQMRRAERAEHLADAQAEVSAELTARAERAETALRQIAALDTRDDEAALDIARAALADSGETA